MNETTEPMIPAADVPWEAIDDIGHAYSMILETLAEKLKDLDQRPSLPVIMMAVQRGEYLAQFTTFRLKYGPKQPTQPTTT